MIGVDTNILLRAVVADDAAQYKLAHDFFEDRSRDDPAYVCLIVLVEFIWSLRRTYRYPENQVTEAVRRLATASDVFIEKRAIVERALASAGNGLGLADLLIAFGNIAEGSGRTVTFDKDAAKTVPGMELLA